MNLDDELCYCFHISRRKLINYVRRERPLVPSQLSLCGGAGTGCGWCIPYLKRLHAEAMAGDASSLEALSAEQYAHGRANYIRSGQGTPPASAAPLPDADLA